MNESSVQATHVMEQPEQSFKEPDLRPATPLPNSQLSQAITPQAGCATCNGGSGMAEKPSYIYAIGRVEARFPNLAAETEFAQATGRSDTAGKTDQQSFHAVLSKREHRYLVRQLCWAFSIQGLDTYLLIPRDPAGIDLLVEASVRRRVPTTSMWSSASAALSRRQTCVMD
jgi:PatG Domain